MFAKFQKNYDEAIESINRCLNTPEDAYDYGMVSLVKWMMETDANPYSYLPENWAGCIGSAEMFASLIHNIHHALYDDGDITFVTVNGEPRIVFVWKGEDNFENYALSQTEKQIRDEQRPGRRSATYEVKVLDISPDQFGPLYDQYQADQVKRWFMLDAWADGADQAATYYRKYKCWNESWVDEARKETN